MFSCRCTYLHSKLETKGSARLSHFNIYIYTKEREKGCFQFQDFTLEGIKKKKKSGGNHHQTDSTNNATNNPQPHEPQSQSCSEEVVIGIGMKLSIYPISRDGKTDEGKNTQSSESGQISSNPKLPLTHLWLFQKPPVTSHTYG